MNYCCEQRAGQRAEGLIQLTNDYQEKSQKALDGLLGKTGNIDESLSKINSASDSINENMSLCAIYAARAKQLFLGAVAASVLIVAGTFWWSYHINSNLSDAKAELATLDTKLKHTPVIVHFNDKDYVCVVPELNVHGRKLSRQYAEECHIR